MVGFNEAAHWVVRTQPLGGIGDLQGQIAGIRADGQTNIFAGLDQAVKSLEGATATRRHIILLTDGWSTSGQYDAIIAKMKADGITLSTVGAGGGANPFLEQLAKQGGGRFYAAANPTSIPDIFLKETQQVSGQQIVEETFFPIQTSSSPILRGLDAGLPQLLGYNGTTAKSAAQTVLVTARDDPLLAQWQYGLGRSVAWTSDSTGRWAKDWVGWNGFDRFFTSWSAGPSRARRPAASRRPSRRPAARPRSTSRASRPTARRATSTRRARVIVGPDLEPRDRARSPRSRPGVYEAPLGEIEPGAYAVRVTQTRPGTSPLGRTVGLVAPTAAEYRLLGANEPFLASLRAGDRRHGRRDGARPVAARPDRHGPVHRAVAAAAGPRPAPVAARHRTAPDVARAARACGGPGWVRGIGRRRRAAGPRTATAEGLLAASGRARTSDARAAMRTAPARSSEPALPRQRRRHRQAPRPLLLRRRPPRLARRRPRRPRRRPRRAAPPPAEAPDTMSRLRDAKRRARDR